jgi:hypothetical protein
MPPAGPELTLPSAPIANTGASPTVPAPSTRVRRSSLSGSSTCGAKPLGRANTNAVTLRPPLSLLRIASDSWLPTASAL